MGPTANQMRASAPPIQTRESQNGAVPQSGVNPASVAPPQNAPAQQGLQLPPAAVERFRRNPDVIEAVRQITGRDFPMSQIDDVLMIQIAGAVFTLGVQGAVAEAERILPAETKATIRGIAMKQNMPRIGGQ